MAEKRGRLNSLDLLPDEAQDDLVWAIGELNKRQRTQADILFEFNDRLAVKGLGPISRPAFNRASVRLASRASKMEERRRIYASIADTLTPSDVAMNDLVLGEFIKTLIDDLVDSEDLTPKNAMELARAYHAAVSAQRVSVERRKAMEAEFAKRTEEVIERVAVEGGLSAERVAQMRRDLLGIRKPDQPEAKS